MNALAVIALLAQTPTPAIHTGGFVDSYIAWDFTRPASIDRAYTTQPVRHSEFNVNLAFLEARLDGERVRGRLALQAGTSVQSNYAGEPRVGTVSGPDVSRFLQEATAGIRVAQPLWVDAGIFFSHIGQESWISRDNPVYTRSLSADYTPYYSTGVRAVWQATNRLTVHVHIVNGWQIISENNESKSTGVRIEYAPSGTLLVGYANFIGNEQPDSVPARTRFFNQAFARVGEPSGTAAWLTFDYGMQSSARWYSVTLIGRHPLSSRVAVNGRLERYADPDQVIVASLGTGGFETWGGSLGLDVRTTAGVLWRTELRGYRGDQDFFPQRAGGLGQTSGFIVTSLALSL